MKVNLYGEIVSDEWAWLYEWFGIRHCQPKQVADAIAALAEGEELVLEINSPGGDVWAGFEIFGLVQGCGHPTTAHVIAMAASAATTVTSACETVLASPVAQIMIHQPSASVTVNNDEARALVKFLDSVKASIINGYVVKAAGKTDRARFEELVDASTWMPVQDAIDLGLVDGILDADGETSAALAEAGSVLVTNAAGVSGAPADLLKRYEAAVRDGAEPAPGHPVSGSGAASPASALPEPAPEDKPDAWRMGASLALERARSV